ncbi:hypothetical protein ANN_17067 [Periplaneta americana]|uniref:Uncharacterized protein n=1 Tax=Periplaneta americana TaxID=6978 RepID=A0ABQ8SU07_PERAM|nr:hypothetical protein ANN_17067 [Periplaneta americana]
MSPGSSTESCPAFARIGLRENPGKNLNQVTCPDRDSNPGHLVSQPDALTVTPQVWTRHVRKNSPQYMFRNSSHSCHYRRYRTYRYSASSYDERRMEISYVLRRSLKLKIINIIIIQFVFPYAKSEFAFRLFLESRLDVKSFSTE